MTTEVWLIFIALVEFGFGDHQVDARAGYGGKMADSARQLAFEGRWS
jgi:hypothetical protein